MLLGLLHNFTKETRLLEDFFVEAVSLKKPVCYSEQQMIAEMAVIRLHDSWARFSRELIVLSAGGQPVTMSGQHLTLAPNISKISDVIPVLMATYKKKRYEPYWARASEAIDSAQRLQVANFSQISSSIGSVNSPADDIRVIRNYYCHRSKSAADEIRGMPWYLSGQKFDPWGIPAMPVTGGISFFESWVFQLRSIASVAVQ